MSHSDCGRHDTGWGHPEHTGRLRAVTRALRSEPELFHSVDHLEGRHATREDIALAHDSGYIDSIERMSAAGGGRLDADTVVSEGSWDAARAATGSVLDGVDIVMKGATKRAFCAVRPPGHHAVFDRAMGFCIFGSVAVAARYARARHDLSRVLIIDWDVHHGNGTQALTETDAGIHFVSMHQWPWYPGTGPATDRGPHGTVWNVPMAGGLAPQAYVDALRAAVDAATASFIPELVLISAGFDCLAGDPLGGFTLEPEHVVELTSWIVERAEGWCNGRVVSALEGGYAPDRVATAAVEHLKALTA
ncbi:MAG: histone deacetylase family protein [Gemmatimonadaceae bacterium]